MTQLLESMTEVKTEALLGRAKRVVTGYDGVVDVAIERVEQFLGQQSAIAKGRLKTTDKMMERSAHSHHRTL
jgi:hypothetical protein